MSDTDFSSFSLDDFSSFEEETASAPATPEQHTLGGAAIAVVDIDQAVREYLSAQFGEGVATAESLAQMESRIGLGPLVIVLGPSCTGPDDFAMVEQWGRTNPEIGTVLVTSELTTQLLQTALRSGVKDVLSAPIDQMQLIDTVGRIADTLHAAPAAPAPQAAAPEGPDALEMLEGERAKVISVFSTKGGSGKSVVATNVAASLARKSAKPVVLIDGHLQFGDVAVMLKLQPRHTIVDAVSQIDRLDAALLTDLLTVHEETGLRVLPAPLEPTFADQITGEQMVQLVDTLRDFAGHIIIDMPAYFNDVVLTLIESSDDVVLVAGLDIPNIKNVKIGLSTLSLLNIGREKIHLVLNRADSKVKLDVGEVEKTLQVTAAAHIPSDVVVPISVNKGVPVVVASPKSGVAKALEQLANRFMDGEAAAAESSSGGRRRFFGG